MQQLTPTPRLRWTAQETLELLRENEPPVVVSTKANFPWTAPESHLSLRDQEGKELALVAEISELDPESQAALRRALAPSNFTIRVLALESVTEDGDLRVWKTRTPQGFRVFQTKLDEWPRTLPDGRVLIPDVAGDLYEIANPAALDTASRKILWALADAD